MATLIQIRRGTDAQWSSANPVLQSGEIGFITDLNRFKVGNGSTAWNSLPYLTADAYENSVALGTDTTGNYVATVNGTADQISVSGSGSENASITLSLPQNISTTSSPTFAGINADLVQIGITQSNEIDTSSGNLVIDSGGGQTTIDDNVIITGDLSVQGITTFIDTTNLQIEDKNIEIGKVGTPTDTTADGGGITLLGTTNKTFNWIDATDSWTSSENIDLANGKVIKNNGTEILSSTQYVGNSATSSNSTQLNGQNASYYLDWTNTTNKPDPTITLGGDLSGSITLTNLEGGTLTATIGANSVALGTDTTGDYVAGVSGSDGVSITGTGEGASVVVANTDKGSSQNIFKNIAVSGQDTIVADSNNDTITMASGIGISLSTDSSTDSLTIANSGVTSITGTSNQIGISASTGSVSVSLPSSIIFPGSVTLNANPTEEFHAATKQYVDNIAQGLHVHAPSKAATTATLASITGGTVTYSNGTNGVGATLTLQNALTTLDGYTLQNGDRILVKNEANAANNGIYTWSTGGTVLTRAIDYDTPTEMAGGDFTFVQNGTLYNDTGWVMTDSVITVGTTNVNFVQFSGAGTYTAGTGLALNGTAFSNTGVLSITGTANEVDVSTSTGNITLSLPATINANTTGNSLTATSATTAGAWTTGRTLTIGSTGKSVNGSSDVSWSLSEIGAQPSDSDLTAIAALAGTSGILKKTAINTWELDTNTYSTTNGTVTSVGLSVPTGLSVSNTPVTTSGTIAISLASGYEIPTTDALSNKAPLASPALTGTPTAPTAAVDTNTTQVATTAYVVGQGYLKSATASSTYAPLASPSLTGTPTAPTAAVDTNTTQIATTAFVESRFSRSSINTQSGLTYTLTLTDAGKTVEMSSASANTITVPLNSAVAFPIGTTMDIVQYGAGQTTIAATAGVTLRSQSGNLKLNSQYAGATLYKRGTDEWVVIGSLKA